MQENIKNDIEIDILSILEEKNTENLEIDILSNIEKNENLEIDILSEINLEEKKENNIVSLFKFLTNYLVTTFLIFVLLLGILNSNSYIQIARSYFNQDKIELEKNTMLASVQSIETKKEKEEKINTIEKEKEEEFNIDVIKDSEAIKNKTFHTMDKMVKGNGDNDINIDVSIIPYENRIIIPKIGKNIPLIDVKNRTVKNVKELEDIFMEELTNGIVRYPGSAKPGEIGNSFIFGHSSNFPWIKGNYNDVFALLDNVVFGDEIIVYYGQKKYVYKIKEKKIVKPGDVSVLKRDEGKSEISLMTCWPIGTTLNRMIVIGEIVEEK